MKDEKKKEPFYYLTLFRRKGQSIWKCEVANDKDHFSKYTEKLSRVVNKKVYLINRVTGEIKEDL